MGRILLATDTVVGTEVIIKEPRTRDALSLARFRREREEQQRAKHQNVMEILESGDDWYVMPKALYSLRKSAPSMLDLDVMAMLWNVTKGLAHAHNLDIVHRDIKPSNLLYVADGRGSRWVVADFGLVKRPPQHTTLFRTGTGAVIGTPGYIAPEARADPRSAKAPADVFSLGCTLSWVLTGVEPQEGRPVDAPPAWADLVGRMTAPALEDRIPDMASVRADLGAVDANLRRENAARRMARSRGGALRSAEVYSLRQILEAGYTESASQRLWSSAWRVHTDACGFNMADVRLALASLDKRGFVAGGEFTDRDGESVAGYYLTPLGWTWAMENSSRFSDPPF